MIMDARAPYPEVGGVFRIDGVLRVIVEVIEPRPSISRWSDPILVLAVAGADETGASEDSYLYLTEFRQKAEWVA
jgi:hypothetical protein